MKLSILLKTVNYRGDHSTDVAIAHELQNDETVEHLAERLLSENGYAGKGCEVIEIRIVQQ